MTNNQAKTLVLGIGNPILGDDGFGWRLIEAVRGQLPVEVACPVELDCLCVGGLELIERLSGYDLVILVDAIQTPDGIPGTVRRLTEEDLLHQPVNQAHGLSFPQALNLAKTLNIPVPYQIVIFTVEIQEQIEFSDRLSPAVEASLAVVARMVLEELKTTPAGHR